MIDEHGRECNPETVCWGHGGHYHCHWCWKVGSMLGCTVDREFTCEDGKNGTISSIGFIPNEYGKFR